MAVSEELSRRIVSAVLLVPVALAMAWTGGLVLLISLIVAAWLMAREWGELVVTPGGALVPASAAGLASIAAHFGYIGTAACGLALIACLLATLSRSELLGKGLAASGPIYLGGACVAILWLRARPDTGGELVLWLLLVVWGTDIGAYFTGRAIGGPRLAPSVSPGKTWAGLIGGLTAAAIVSGGVAETTGVMALVPALLAGCGISAVAQIGDLFESWLKRRQGLKDSGDLIPGHGGLLDRVDGLMAAAPVLAITIWLTNG